MTHGRGFAAVLGWVVGGVMLGAAIGDAAPSAATEALRDAGAGVAPAHPVGHLHPALALLLGGADPRGVWHEAMGRAPMGGRAPGQPALVPPPEPAAPPGFQAEAASMALQGPAPIAAAAPPAPAPPAPAPPAPVVEGHEVHKVPEPASLAVPPAMPPSAAAPSLPDGMVLLRPATGPVTQRFGAVEAGGTSNGVTIAAPSGTVVRAPLGATVVFAGAMRGSRGLLILEAGPNLHVVLGGLDRIEVRTGDRVAAGQTVGFLAGGQDPRRSDARALRTAPLYLELRIDGQPVDPLTVPGFASAETGVGARRPAR